MTPKVAGRARSSWDWQPLPTGGRQSSEPAPSTGMAAMASPLLPSPASGRVPSTAHCQPCPLAGSLTTSLPVLTAAYRGQTPLPP